MLISFLVGGSLLSIVIGIVISVLLIRLNKFHNTQNEGRALFVFDNKTRLLKPYKGKGVANNINKIFPKQTSSGIDIARFLSAFNNNKILTTMRSIEHNLLKTSEPQSDSVRYVNESWSKTLAFTLTFKMCGIESEEDQSMLEVKWEVAGVISKTMSSTNQMELIEIINDQKLHKGFIVFNLNPTTEERGFIKTLSLASKTKKINYFVDNNSIYAYFSANSEKLIKWQLKSFIRNVENSRLRIAIERGHLGSAKIITNKINSNKNISILIKLAEYLSYISIRHRIKFVDKYSEMFNKEEAKQFIESLRTFRENLKLTKVEHDELSIRKRRGPKRKIFGYRVPNMKRITKGATEKILLNDNNRNMLTDVYATICSRKKTKESFMIDITEDWLIAEWGRIVNHKLIYTLNASAIKQQAKITEIVSDLMTDEFRFSIKTSNYDESFSNLIMNLKPDSIVIADKLASQPYSSNNYLKIISIIKLAKQLDIVVIFENPIKFTDHRREVAIGLKYFYSTDEVD